MKLIISYTVRLFQYQMTGHQLTGMLDVLTNLVRILDLDGKLTRKMVIQNIKEKVEILVKKEDFAIYNI